MLCCVVSHVLCVLSLMFLLPLISCLVLCRVLAVSCVVLSSLTCCVFLCCFVFLSHLACLVLLCLFFRFVRQNMVCLVLSLVPSRSLLSLQPTSDTLCLMCSVFCLLPRLGNVEDCVPIGLPVSTRFLLFVWSGLSHLLLMASFFSDVFSFHDVLFRIGPVYLIFVRFILSYFLIGS
jgi:hypothetical protein